MVCDLIVGVSGNLRHAEIIIEGISYNHCIQAPPFMFHDVCVSNSRGRNCVIINRYSFDLGLWKWLDDASFVVLKQKGGDRSPAVDAVTTSRTRAVKCQTEYF